MSLDHSRLEEILEADHSYYGSRPANYRNDTRLNASAPEFIARHFTPDMRVLDIGCGSGETLLQYSDRFREGVGVDYDADHIRLAEDALKASGVGNVTFRHVDFHQRGEDLVAESFDYVFSERGLAAYSTGVVQAALEVLGTGGLLFCEVIGDLHHQEVKELFGDGPRLHQSIRTSDQVRVALERCGVSIRIAADIVAKRYYPSIYEWLQFQCSIWAWSGGPLPSPEDERLRLFAERNTTPSGEIETTHHVVWVGGVKMASSPYSPS